MKLVNTDYDLLGFERTKTYRCNQCSTENTRSVNETTPIKCQWCKREVEIKDVKS